MGTGHLDMPPSALPTRILLIDTSRLIAIPQIRLTRCSSPPSFGLVW